MFGQPARDGSSSCFYFLWRRSATWTVRPSLSSPTDPAERSEFQGGGVFLYRYWGSHRLHAGLCHILRRRARSDRRQTRFSAGSWDSGPSRNVPHAVAASWIDLWICRFLLGLGENFNSPAGVKALVRVDLQRASAASAWPFFPTAMSMGGNHSTSSLAVYAHAYRWAGAGRS